MTRFLLYIAGFILLVVGLVYFIIYTNLFTFGYSLKEYSLYLFTHLETYSLFLGIFLLLLALYKKGK